LIPGTEFSVQEQSQTLIEGEILDLCETRLFVQSLSHGVEIELTQRVQSGLL
jgi:hypothetical protein